MGPPLYDSSRPGSILSRFCSDGEEVDEANMDQLKLEFHPIWDEDIMITSGSDIEDIISKSHVEQDEIGPSPQDASIEYWVNPFAITVEDEASPDVTDDCYTHIPQYDTEVIGLSSLTVGQAYCSLQPMMSPDHHSHPCSS